MFQRIKTDWQTDISNQQSKAKILEHSINDIFNQYFNLNAYAKSNYQKISKDNAIIKGKFRRIKNEFYSLTDYRQFKQSAQVCWNFLAKVTKGTYCMICDSNESAIRFGDSSIWKASFYD